MSYVWGQSCKNYVFFKKIMWGGVGFGGSQGPGYSIGGGGPKMVENH